MAAVTKQAVNLFVRSGGTVEPGKSVASQGGILEGQDPSHYDPKNPVRKTASQSTKFDALTDYLSRSYCSLSRPASSSVSAELCTFPLVTLRSPGSSVKCWVVSS